MHSASSSSVESLRETGPEALPLSVSFVTHRPSGHNEILNLQKERGKERGLGRKSQ